MFFLIFLFYSKTALQPSFELSISNVTNTTRKSFGYCKLAFGSTLKNVDHCRGVRSAITLHHA